MDTCRAGLALVQNAEEEGPIRFIAGTEGMKVDGRSYTMSGGDFERYLRNPVFLWAHDQRLPPIGRSLTTEVDGSQLVIDVEFDQEDSFARGIEAKYRGGYLNAVSMNGVPLDGEGKPTFARGTVDRWELVEISAVPVPLDPDSLAVAPAGARSLLHGLTDSMGSLLLDSVAETSNQIADPLEGLNIDVLARALEGLGFARSDPSSVIRDETDLVQLREVLAALGPEGGPAQ